MERSSVHDLPKGAPPVSAVVVAVVAVVVVVAAAASASAIVVGVGVTRTSESRAPGGGRGSMSTVEATGRSGSALVSCSSGGTKAGAVDG